MKKLIIVLLFLLILNFVSADTADPQCSNNNSTNETCSINSINPINNSTVSTVSTVSAVEIDPNTRDHSTDELCVVYFYGQECSKCAQIKPFIDEVEKKYQGKIYVTRLEIYHNLNNYNSYNNFCGINNIALEERGIPLVAVNNEYLMGASAIKENLEDKIDYALENNIKTCPLDDMTCHNTNITKSDSQHIVQKKISLPLILVSGLIDGINPCAFAVLIFLLMFLLQISNNRKKMVKAGIAYIMAVYATYFLAGFGILSIIQLTGFSSIILKVAAFLAIIFGLINIKDYFWYGKGISLQITESKKGIIQKWTEKANIPAAIVLGFLVSMFELPCTGGIYLAILAMLANSVTSLQATLYLLVYNLMFILPLIIILILVVKGMKTEHIENWRKSQRSLMKLLMGLLLLILGIGMLLGWF